MKNWLKIIIIVSIVVVIGIGALMAWSLLKPYSPEIGLDANNDSILDKKENNTIEDHYLGKEVDEYITAGLTEPLLHYNFNNIGGIDVEDLTMKSNGAISNPSNTTVVNDIYGIDKALHIKPGAKLEASTTISNAEAVAVAFNIAPEDLRTNAITEVFKAPNFSIYFSDNAESPEKRETVLICEINGEKKESKFKRFNEIEAQNVDEFHGPGDGYDWMQTYKENLWTHIAVVYDKAAKTVAFYMDGKLDSVKTLTNAPSIDLSAVTFGNNSNCTFSDVRLYDNALTAEEIDRVGGFEHQLWAIRDQAMWNPSAYVFYVDGINGDDSNDGSTAFPVKTIAKGLSLLPSAGSKLVIRPGVYYEADLNIPKAGTRFDPVIVEAETKGTVFIDGSAPFIGAWTSEENGVWSADWTYNWDKNDHWELGSVSNDLAKRKEMLIVDGEIIEQVLSKAALRNESFFVDNDGQKIYYKSAKDMNTAEVTVPASTGTTLMNIKYSEYVAVRGLTFRYFNQYAVDAAFYIEASAHLLIEDCVFTQNNGYGLRTDWSGTVNDVVMRRSKFIENGSCGFQFLFKNRNILAEDCEIKGNLWRMLLGLYYGPDLSAVGKNMFVKNVTYRRLAITENNYRGMWLDYKNCNVTVEDCYFANNDTDFWTEVNHQGIYIRNNVFYNSRLDRSFIVAGCENNVITGNVFYQNNMLPVGQWEEGSGEYHPRDIGFNRVPLTMSGTIFTNNIVAAKKNMALFRWYSWQQIYENAVFAENKYYAEGTSATDPLFYKAAEGLNFSQWLSLTNDATSTFLTANPFALSSNTTLGFKEQTVKRIHGKSYVIAEVTLNQCAESDVSVKYTINGNNAGVIDRTETQGTLQFAKMQKSNAILLEITDEFKGDLTITLSNPTGAAIAQPTCTVVG